VDQITSNVFAIVRNQLEEPPGGQGAKILWRKMVQRDRVLDQVAVGFVCELSHGVREKLSTLAMTHVTIYKVQTVLHLDLVLVILLQGSSFS
jgi:hypothetical protein